LILSEFKNDENIPIDDKDQTKMDELIDQFNVYWKNYQDKWTPNYWQVYEALHEKNNYSENEISDIYPDKIEEENKFIFCNDSLLDDNLNMKVNYNNNNKNNSNINSNNYDLHNNPFIINSSSNNNNNNIFNSKDNLKFNSTNHQTKTLINLQEIDDELENIKDVSMIMEKKQKEKRRNCFDCTVF